MNVFKLLLVLGLAGAAFFAGWMVGGFNAGSAGEVEARSSSESVAAPRPVKAQGKLVPRSGLVNIFGPPNQTIEAILVSSGQPLEKGKTELATFPLTAALRRQAELAESQAADAKLELKQRLQLADGQVHGTRVAVSLAELQLEQARLRDLLEVPARKLESAKAKLARLESLSKDPKTEAFVATTAIDEQKLAISEAEIQLQYAEKQHAAGIKAAELQLETANLAYRSAQDAQTALLELQQNPASVDLAVAVAKSAVEDARLLAPLDGTVVQVLAKAGDVAMHTPLMQVANLSKMDCVAEVPDRLIGQIALGDAASLESPALSRQLTGTVVEINPVVGNSSLPDPNPLAVVDRRSIEVRIEISAADIGEAAKLLHLQVNVSFSKK
jgi:HlyD family secretion protein